MTVWAYAYLALAAPVLIVTFAICRTSSRCSREEEAAEAIKPVERVEPQLVADGRWAYPRRAS